MLKLVKENDVKQNLYAVSSSRDKKLYLVDGKYNKDSSSPRIQILFADDKGEYLSRAQLEQYDKNIISFTKQTICIGNTKNSTTRKRRYKINNRI